MRSVAAQAGVSLGRVRYYFASKDELLLHSLEHAHRWMEARIGERVAQTGGDDRDVLIAILDELLGEHPETRTAIRVHAAFAARGIEDGRMAVVLTDGDEEILTLAVAVVAGSQAAGRVKPEGDPSVTATRSGPSLVGLGTEVALYGAPVQRARRTLEHCIERLAPAREYRGPIRRRADDPHARSPPDRARNAGVGDRHRRRLQRRPAGPPARRGQRVLDRHRPRVDAPTPPGGLALVHLEGPLRAGNLLALHRGKSPTVKGRFLPWWGCFMRRRSTSGPTTGTPRPVPTTEPHTSRHTTVDPAEFDGGQMFPFLAQLHLPPGMFRSIRLADDQTPVTYLAAADGSWCEITRTPDASGHYAVREAGPTAIWAAIETAWARWTDLGAPRWHDCHTDRTPHLALGSCRRRR